MTIFKKSVYALIGPDSLSVACSTKRVKKVTRYKAACHYTRSMVEKWKLSNLNFTLYFSHLSLKKWRRKEELLYRQFNSRKRIKGEDRDKYLIKGKQAYEPVRTNTPAYRITVVIFLYYIFILAHYDCRGVSFKKLCNEISHPNRSLSTVPLFKLNYWIIADYKRLWNNKKTPPSLSF